MKRIYIGGVLIGLGLLKFLKIFALFAIEDMFALYFGAVYGVNVATIFVVVGAALIFWWLNEKKYI